MKNKKIALCMMICMVSVLQGTQEHLMELLDEALLLLDELQHNTHAYIPRIYNKELAYLLQDLSEEQIIEALQIAEPFDNDYLLNGIAAVLVDHLFVTGPVQVPDLQDKLSPRAYAFVEKYMYLRKEVTRACGDVDRSVADYVGEFGVPLEYLGNVGILRFNGKMLTSLYGIQDLNYTDVGAAMFYNNCILGNTLDPQFPTNAFQGLPNISSLVFQKNKLESLPSNFLENISGLTSLNLNQVGITQFPNGFFSGLDQIGQLSLSNNKISTATTVDLIDMENLEILYLDYNSIIEIPDNFFENNPNLQAITLNNNKLSSWPSAVLNNLLYFRSLDLSYNKIASFEPEILRDGSEIVLTGNLLTTSQKDFIQSSFPEVNFVF